MAIADDQLPQGRKSLGRIRTHDTITECWTDHELRTHTKDRTRDSDDKCAPPPCLELSCPLQQKPKEEQKRELDAENAAIKKNRRGILKLDIEVELVYEIGRRSFHAGAHIHLCLIVGQGKEYRNGTCHQ